jgi:rhombotail lipoprotein
MLSRRFCVSVCCAALLVGSACVVHQRQLQSSALDFLYPEGSEAVPPTDVELELPIRVGLAFAPTANRGSDAFTEDRKLELLERIAADFRDREAIRRVEVIPTSYLQPGGSFENLDQLVSAFGIDVIALISYDQFQFSESGRSSWAYWTLIGAYVVKGEKNETRTVMDAVIYDIPSRAMLFHATGQDSDKGRATPVDVSKSLRDESTESFQRATEVLVESLNVALDEFIEQAASGTVRGEGTPAVAMVDENGQPVTISGGGSGAGSLGVAGLLAGLLLLLPGLGSRDRRGPRA